MAFNIAPDEIQIPRISLDRCHLDSRELEETSIGNYSGHAPTASRLRTELTDRAGLTKPKHRHEYFPNLPEPKGFSHGLPASRRQKFSRRSKSAGMTPLRSNSWRRWSASVRSKRCCWNISISTYGRWARQRNARDGRI